MPKSLKQTAEPDVFDFGKAVTIVLSGVKELNKTRNTLVDDVNYLEARKKQEKQELERILAEKAKVVSLKDEVTKKIIAMKSGIEADVSAKREELSLREADLVGREDALATDTARLMQDITDRQNELARRGEENKKQWDASMEALNKRETALIAREEAVTQVVSETESDKLALDTRKASLDEREARITAGNEARVNKQGELDLRERSIAVQEVKLEAQRVNLAKLAGDLENQASLLEAQRSKNKADAEFIRDLTKAAKEKQQELANREIHLKDRETTALSH